MLLTFNHLQYGSEKKLMRQSRWEKRRENHATNFFAHLDLIDTAEPEHGMRFVKERSVVFRQPWLKEYSACPSFFENRTLCAECVGLHFLHGIFIFSVEDAKISLAPTGLD